MLFSNELSGDSDKVTVLSVLEPLVKISFKLISLSSWLSSLFKVVGSGKFSKSGGSDNGFKQVILGEYSLFNLYADYNFPGYKFNVAIKNLLNEDYNEAFNYSTPGRSLNVKFTNKF